MQAGYGGYGGGSCVIVYIIVVPLTPGKPLVLQLELVEVAAGQGCVWELGSSPPLHRRQQHAQTPAPYWPAAYAKTSPTHHLPPTQSPPPWRRQDPR
jgi:hypothetical protein